MKNRTYNIIERYARNAIKLLDNYESAFIPSDKYDEFKKRDPIKSWPLLSVPEKINRKASPITLAKFLNARERLIINWYSDAECGYSINPDFHNREIFKADLWESCDVNIEKWFKNWRIGNQFGTHSCVGWCVAQLVDYTVSQRKFFEKNKVRCTEFTQKSGMLRNMKTNNFLEVSRSSSPRFYWMGAKLLENDGGGSATVMNDYAGAQIDNALDLVRREYHVSEEKLPFLVTSPVLTPSEKFFTKWPNNKNLLSGLDVEFTFNINEGKIDLKRFLALIGPVILGFIPDKSYWAIQDTSKFYLDEYDDKDREKPLYNHYCLCTGFTKKK